MQRQNVSLIANADAKTIDDRQSQRQADRDRCALAEVALDADSSPESFNISSHHIHSDSSAGKIRDFFSSGKTRFENEFEKFMVGQLFGIGDYSCRTQPCGDAIAVQASAVVDELNHDVGALVKSFERNRGTWFFTCLPSCLGWFNTVIE